MNACYELFGQIRQFVVMISSSLNPYNRKRKERLYIVFATPIEQSGQLEAFQVLLGKASTWQA